MSPSTYPGSTEASWCESPSRITRAFAGSASRSFAIIVSGTMEASSTTITSTGSGFAALWRKVAVSGRAPGDAEALSARLRDHALQDFQHGGGFPGAGTAGDDKESPGERCFDGEL